MLRDPQQPPSPIGVVYNTSMRAPGAALAVAALHVLASRREARVNGICVTGVGLSGAIFCDVIGRFYSGQTRTPSSNTVLPIGFAADPILPGPPMVDAALARTRDDGSPQYARSIQRPSDTAAPDALLRNAITLTVDVVVVLSAPATWLTRSLELAHTADEYKRRVKRVVIVESGGAGEDAGALERLKELLPEPPIICPAELGRSLAVSTADLAARITWAAPHPIVDVLRSWPNPTVTLDDLAAAHYAVYPDAGFYTVTERRLTVAPSQREACLAALTGVATSKPTPAPARGGRGI